MKYGFARAFEEIGGAVLAKCSAEMSRSANLMWL